MSHDVRWRGLAAYLLLLLVVSYAIFCVSHSAAAYGRMGTAVSWTTYTPAGSKTAQYTIGWVDYLGIAANPWSGRRIGGVATSPRGLVGEFWDLAFGAALTLAAIHVLCAAGFAALPQSRRRAKVRWAHIVRIWAYGFGLFAPAAALTLAGTALAAQQVPVLSSAGEVVLSAGTLCIIAVVPVEVVWWSTATGRYLRMPHAWGVGLSVVVMALLAVSLLATWVSLA